MKSRRIRATDFELRDVAADQEPLVDAEGHDLDRQRRIGFAERVDDHRVAEVAGLEIADDFGLPREVEQRRAGVAREIDAEVRLRARVGPFDAVRRVENHHAFGQRFDRASEALDRRGEVALLALARAQPGDRARRSATPHAPAASGTGASSSASAQRASRSRCQRSTSQQRAESDAQDHGSPEGAQREPGEQRQHQDDEGATMPATMTGRMDPVVGARSLRGSASR